MEHTKVIPRRSSRRTDKFRRNLVKTSASQSRFELSTSNP